MCESYGTPSKGLMQTIEPGWRGRDPLANMTAAVNWARSEYAGRWMDDELEYRPRRNGKSSVIERAEAIAETVKPRPEMAEIMERAMAMPHYASGGVVPSPTGRIKTFMSPGEWVMTPEMARAKAEELLERVSGGVGRYTPEERAALDEGILAAIDDLRQVPEPPDDYPDPPELPCF